MLMTVACTVAAACLLFAAVTVLAACKLAGEADREMAKLFAEWRDD